MRIQLLKLKLLKMGGKTSKPVVKDNAGSIINEIEIHQAEITNSDLIFILYVVAIVHVIQLVLAIYKMWSKNMKKRYMARAKSVELL